MPMVCFSLRGRYTRSRNHGDVTLMMMSRRRWLLGLALMPAMLGMSNRSQPPTLVRLSGMVTGGSGRHTIHVALWSEPRFLEKPAQETRIASGRDTRYTFVVDRGRWAISAYEDRNENGVLDMGVFGPKEPSGFWRPFRGWHKPRFADVASMVDGDIPDANVSLR